MKLIRFLFTLMIMVFIGAGLRNGNADPKKNSKTEKTEFSVSSAKIATEAVSVPNFVFNAVLEYPTSEVPKMQNGFIIPKNELITTKTLSENSRKPYKTPRDNIRQNLT